MKDSDKNKIRKALTKSDDNKLTHCQKIRYSRDPPSGQIFTKCFRHMCGPT